MTNKTVEPRIPIITVIGCAPPCFQINNHGAADLCEMPHDGRSLEDQHLVSVSIDISGWKRYPTLSFEAQVLKVIWAA